SVKYTCPSYTLTSSTSVIICGPPFGGAVLLYSLCNGLSEAGVSLRAPLLVPAPPGLFPVVGGPPGPPGHRQARRPCSAGLCVYRHDPPLVGLGARHHWVALRRFS